MIRKVSTKPNITKINFRLMDPANKAYASGPVVYFWIEIEAKGIRFSSEGTTAQNQHLGKFLIGPPQHEEQQFWNEDTLVCLSESIAKLDEASAAMMSNANLCKQVLETKASQVGKTSLETLTGLRDRYELFSAREADARNHLESLEKEMVTPDFLNFFNKVAIPLKCDDSNEERAYAFYRGTVWSCTRELEPEQWSVLADRFIEREELELAAALAGGESTPGRERISAEVRRAVWLRDQGKCARCGSRERLEFDHIVPLARGGSNTERNIELLCEICNRAKATAIE